jgi:hypothetical protein
MIGEGMQGVKGLGRCLACQPLSGVPPKRMRRRNGGFESEGHPHGSKDCAGATLFPISRQSVDPHDSCILETARGCERLAIPVAASRSRRVTRCLHIQLAQGTRVRVEYHGFSTG